MAKPITINSIDLEVSRVSDRVKEFQDYLEKNSIITKVNDSGDIMEAEEDTDRYKEIDVQIKMTDAVLRWLPLLKSLRDDETKRTQTHGGAEMNGLLKNKNNGS